MLGKAVDLNTLKFACLTMKDIQIISDLKEYLSRKFDYLPHEQTTTGRERNLNPTIKKRSEESSRNDSFVLISPPAGGDHRCEYCSGHTMSLFVNMSTLNFTFF